MLKFKSIIQFYPHNIRENYMYNEYDLDSLKLSKIYLPLSALSSQGLLFFSKLGMVFFNEEDST